MTDLPIDPKKFEELTDEMDDQWKDMQSGKFGDFLKDLSNGIDPFTGKGLIPPED